jgi:glutathione S-transferase
MLTLYHNDMSVCAAKVRTALAAKKLDWNGVHLDLRGGDAQKPEYLKLNPNAVVPTLVHDGRVITESTVICEYVDDQWPDQPLKPRDSFGRAQMRLWTKQLDEGLHPAVGTLSFCVAFRHQWLARPAEDRAKWLANIPQPERRQRLQSTLELGLDSPFFMPAFELTAAGLVPVWPVEANLVFVVLPRALDARLKAAGARYYGRTSTSFNLGPDQILARLVTSFATQEDEIDRFAHLCKADSSIL